MFCVSPETPEFEKARSNLQVTEGNWGSERLRDIPKVTQRFVGRAGTRAHVCLLQVPCSLASSLI